MWAIAHKTERMLIELQCQIQKKNKIMKLLGNK